MIGIGARRDGLHAGRAASLRRPAARPASAATAAFQNASPRHDARRASGSSKPRAPSSRRRISGSFERRPRFRARGRRRCARPARRGARAGEQFVATVQAMKPGDIVEGARPRRKHMRLRVIDHLHAMLDCPQQPIGVAERSAPRRPRGARPRRVRRSHRAWPASAPTDRARRGSSAGSGRRTRPRGCRRARA